MSEFVFFLYLQYGQISGERLQDHWSSGFIMESVELKQQVLFRADSLSVTWDLKV